jgi:hypothetical protein
MSATGTSLIGSILFEFFFLYYISTLASPAYYGENFLQGSFDNGAGIDMASTEYVV